MDTLKRLWQDEEAATAVEYAIIAAVVGVALIGTLVLFRESIKGMLTKAAQTISNQ
ncbi:MAG: Flp family type IVb pilin [Myxococcota bacterium]|jgi:pilus assembly protein Flp/PilA|nr:Flp family type IVb pilin [Myxococcota bacterium]